MNERPAPGLFGGKIDIPQSMLYLLVNGFFHRKKARRNE
jgi:hypothetical protein